MERVIFTDYAIKSRENTTLVLRIISRAKFQKNSLHVKLELNVKMNGINKKGNYHECKRRC